VIVSVLPAFGDAMAIRLNQLLAIEKQVKDSAMTALTAAYHDAQKSALVNGMTRTYQPLDEEGEQFPSEEKVLEVRISDVLRDTQAKLSELLDLTVRKDLANCGAKASVMIGDKVIIADAPATYLLWLEKKLLDVRTFVSKLPRLSSDERWTWDDAQNCWISAPSKTVKTKKIAVPITLAPATEQHPAQVQLTAEDRTIGHWTTVKFSGALPANKVALYLDRIEQLIAAVKQARVKANSVECPNADAVGSQVLGFIFG